MRGLEKHRMKGDRHPDRQTSRLYDRIGPVGRFDEKLNIDPGDSKEIKMGADILG